MRNDINSYINAITYFLTTIVNLNTHNNERTTYC